MRVIGRHVVVSIWDTAWQNQQNDLCAWRKYGSLATHWGLSKDSDQTGRFRHEVAQIIVFTSKSQCLLRLHGGEYMSHSMSKPTKWPVRPAKTQISLGVCPVWSEFLLCAQWVAKDPRFLHADNEDWSDWVDAQADLCLRWAYRSFCWFCHSAAQLL